MNSARKTLDGDGAIPPRVCVLGVGISVVDMQSALRRSIELIESGKQGYVCAVDAHSVVESLRDCAHRRVLNSAYLAVADGMPLVWMCKLRREQRVGRVYGPDFLLQMCRISERRGWRHFFYGGAPDVAERLAAQLRTRFPDLTIAGVYSPPFRPLTDVEESNLAAMVERARPDVLWVGLGSPKQDRFMAAHCGKLHCSVMVGVGAAFDFHSGTVKEAPRWLHRTGLQWTHRLVHEPRRLAGRYLRCIPVFLWNAGLQLAGVRTFSNNTQ